MLRRRLGPDAGIDDFLLMLGALVPRAVIVLVIVGSIIATLVVVHAIAPRVLQVSHGLLDADPLVGAAVAGGVYSLIVCSV